MTRGPALAASIAVLLTTVWVAPPPVASQSAVEARDKVNDVGILPFTSPHTTITKTERLSIDIKRLSISPRAGGTVRFEVQIGRVLSSKRFYQQVDVIFRRARTSTAGWSRAAVDWQPSGPFGPYAYMDLADPLGGTDYTQRRCRPRDVRQEPGTTTLAMTIADRCVPVGDAKLHVIAKTRFRTGGDTSSTDDFSRDFLKVPLAVVRSE